MSAAQHAAILALLACGLAACTRADDSHAPDDDNGGTSGGLNPQPVPIPTPEVRFDVDAVTVRAEGARVRIEGAPGAVTGAATVFVWNLTARARTSAVPDERGAFTALIDGAAEHPFHLVGAVEALVASVDVVGGPQGRAVERPIARCINRDRPDVALANAPVDTTTPATLTLANGCDRDLDASVLWVSGPSFAAPTGGRLTIPRGGTRALELQFAPRMQGVAVDLALVRVGDVDEPLTLLGFGRAP